MKSEIFKPLLARSNRHFYFQDIITAFDGKAVNSPYELYSQVLIHKVGDSVKLTVSRNGQSLELNLTVSGLSDSIKNVEKDKQNSLQNS